MVAQHVDGQPSTSLLPTNVINWSQDYCDEYLRRPHGPLLRYSGLCSFFEGEAGSGVEKVVGEQFVSSLREDLSCASFFL